MKNYEQKYKEALEVVKRKLCFDKAGMVDSFTPNDIYEMFPELRESEDEKIRKELLGFLRNIPNSNYTCEEMAHWLEKQGIRPRYNIGDILCDKLCTTLNKDAQPNMEIIDIKNGMYICDKGSFPVSQQDEYELVSKKIDTKLNDNSVSNELREASFAHARKELKNPTCPDNEELELVYTFEEGAKWNAAQKPVDKVEPKFKVEYAGNEYNVFDVKDIAGVTFYGIEDEPNHIDYVQAEHCKRISGYGIKENGSPYPTKPAKFSEQKPTLSEEDEVILDEIIDFFENGTVKLQHDLSLYASWLKSLKYRVGCEANCTTTKEWSEEDENILQWIISDIVRLNKDSKKSNIISNKEINWLKSLKDRVKTQQEWTMQDEEELQIALDTLAKAGQHSSAKWLKNVCLVPQNKWKPSEEQMAVLNEVINYAANSELQHWSNFIYTLLKSLREQLKKL